MKADLRIAIKNNRQEKSAPPRHLPCGNPPFTEGLMVCFVIA
jgi:hypothetical protein